MAMAPIRIVSLLPSATEIVCYLGFGSALVGRSHECDFPAGIEGLPVCTAPRFNPQGSSRVIHNRVTKLLHSALSVYQVNLAQLRQLQPTHIITQAQCAVCAVSLSDVEAAVATLSPMAPQIISLQPNSLAALWEDISRVAIALDPEGGARRAKTAVSQLQQRLQACQQRVPNQLPQPTVACLEWTEPLMVAGNWVPELVTLAGGHPLFGQIGQPSAWLSWEQLTAADPDLIILMPCGYDLEQTYQATRKLALQPAWEQLQAVKSCRIYLADGNHYFNRPGPRLVDSLEILAEILHPEACPYGYALKAWQIF
jgi:iron complex transport system substrate-binding protein